jgi:raffinose/stachyose/melibiose transport system permease protein
MGTLKSNKVIILFLLPALLLYSVFFLIPFTETIIFSFYNWDGFTKPSFIGITNFIIIFSDNLFFRAIGRVIIWAILAIIFKVGSALILSYMLKDSFKGSKFFRSCIFMPYIISAGVMSLMFIVIYDRDIGFLNNLLRLLGLGDFIHSWLGEQETAFFASIAIPIWQAIGYFFVILLAAMQNIPDEVYDSAKIDGSNAFTTFVFITIPTIWDTIAVCVVLSINGAFQ